MAIVLDKITPSNFKSIVSAGFLLSSYTALIGYNNTGKSNILSAIQWLVRKSVLDISAFNDPTQPLQVSGTVSGIEQVDLDGMPARQQDQIRAYIVDGVLTILRTQPQPNCRAADITFSVLDPTSGSWVANPTGIDNAIGTLLPEPIVIGAMEDVAEDASKAKTSTTIGKLLAEFLAPVQAAHREEINVHLKEVERRISADGDSRLSELPVFESSINQKINDLFPGIQLKLHFQVPSLEELIKAGTVKVYEGDGPSRSFTSYGHGAQRSIQMALVRQLAEVRRGTTPQSGRTLLLIDEPELYLHPFAIEQIREALKSLATSGYQVVFSSHSAQMITSLDAQHALLIKKSDGLGTHSRRRLHDAIQNVVPNSVHQMEQLFTLGNASQILFCDRAVLAEGKTEQRLLPAIFQAQLGVTLGQRKLALIAQSGVNDSKKSMDILAAMDIPTKAIVDLDYVFHGGVEHGFISSTDPNIVQLKANLARLAPVHGFSLDPSSGLPQKNQNMSASKAIEFLALDTDSITHIQAIHNHLRGQGIWVWTKGSIESHIGIAAKNEREWARFQTALITSNLSAVCTDYQSVAGLVAWLNT